RRPRHALAEPALFRTAPLLGNAPIQILQWRRRSGTGSVSTRRSRRRGARDARTLGYGAQSRQIESAKRAIVGHDARLFQYDQAAISRQTGAAGVVVRDESAANH